MKKLLISIFSIVYMVACVPVAQQSGPSVANPSYYADKKFRTSDYIYEPSIHTVMLYPKLPEDADQASANLQPPVIPLRGGTPLVLEFDEMGNQFRNFRAKIFHCDADWSLSLLNDLDFVEDFNDFLFNQPTLSFNTKIPYVHYTFEVPRVKISGNYVLMVYREGNVKDIVLTKRFMVYENLVSITSAIQPSTGVRERYLNQQVEFAVNYPGYPLNNPRQTVKVAIRQNYKWNNAILNLLPTSIKEDISTLEYNHFNLENNFPGLNEFRFFDMRSIRFLGINMGKIDAGQDSTTVYVLPDKSRAKESYSQINDFNGRYIIDNYETKRGATEADYVNVRFTLRYPEQVNGNVHLWGEFMNYQPGNNTLMTYDATTQTYTGEYLLKQGYYNYMYVLETTPGERINEAFFAGSHFNTENHYEIIVYYRPLGSRSDLIIGYDLIRFNGRN